MLEDAYTVIPSQTMAAGKDEGIDDSVLLSIWLDRATPAT